MDWTPEGIEIMLPRSMTDQLNEGIVKAIQYSDSPCRPAPLRAWLGAVDIATGPVFRPISNWGRAVASSALSVGSVNTIPEDCATPVQLDYVTDLSSHSLRRGMATSAHRAGTVFRYIKGQGGWRHDDTVQAYIEEAGRFEENAIGSLLRTRERPVLTIDQKVDNARFFASTIPRQLE